MKQKISIGIIIAIVFAYSVVQSEAFSGKFTQKNLALPTIVSQGLALLNNATRKGQVLSSNSTSSSVLGHETENPAYTFNVNVPAEFMEAATFLNGVVVSAGELIADNIIYSITGGTGISVTGGQNPTITNTGVISLQGKTGAVTLTSGSGITLDGVTMTNSDKGSSVQTFKTIHVSGQNDVVADGNTDGLTFVGAGGITLATNADTDTLTITSPTPDYTLSGWTDSGDVTRLTTTTDFVGIGTNTPTSELHVVGSTDLSGDVTIGSSSANLLTIRSLISTGSTITPATDLGADLGSGALRFNNLWVANINSNDSSSFAGQTVFSYPPQDTTTAQSSVWINPDASTVANGQLLAFSIAGYQRALVDAEGDIVLGYNGATSAPATSNPLTVYGHNSSLVASVNTSGTLSTSGSLGINGVTNDIAGSLNLSGNNLTSSGALAITPAAGQNLNIVTSAGGQFTVNSSQLTVDSTTGRVGIGTANATTTLQIGTILNVDDSAGSVGIGGTATAKLYAYGATTAPVVLVRQNSTGDILQASDNGALVFVVKDGGNVGIGTTAPDSKLEVSGTNTGKALVSLNETGSNNILVASSSGTNRLVLTSTGNLGIGTTTPTDKLQVAGTISSEVLANVEGLRLTNNGTTKLAFKYTEGAAFLDTPSSTTANKFTNPSFDAGITGWNYGYTLDDEFSDTLPQTLATSTPVTIQSGGVTNPTPTLGSEVVLNGGFDTDSNWSKGSGWTISGGVAVDTNSTGLLYQGGAIVGTWYQETFDLLNRSGGSVTAIVGLTAGRTRSANGTYVDTMRATNTNYNGVNANGIGVLNVDNISVKPLTLSSLFSTVSTSVANEYTAQTDVTMTAGTQAGLVVNLDNATTPANFVIAYHDGTNVHLEKVVAGTYTSLINTAATYAAGRTLKVVQNGTSYSLYYNGTKVGSTVSITDAGIISNTRHGVFSTYASNSFANFLVQSTVVNPSPVAGSELVTNGSFNDNSWWNTFGTNTSVSGGKANLNGETSFAITRWNLLSAGIWYQVSYDISSYVSGRIYATLQDALLPANSSNGTFVQTGLDRTSGTLGFTPNTLASTFSLDNISLKPLTLSSLFSTVTVASSTDHTVQADPTVTAGTQGGVVLNMDSSTNPTKFVIGYTNGTQACLDKNVSGTYTAVIACTNITYVAGQTLKVIQNGTSYSLFYNGTQVGTTQTISDVPTTNIHGLFSTYASNSFANFTVKGGVNGTLATDGTNLRTVADTTGKLSIGSGTAIFSGGNSVYGNPAIWHPAITRAPGKIFITDYQYTDSIGLIPILGISSTQSGNPLGNGAVFIPQTGALTLYEGSNQITLGGGLVSGTRYKLALVLKNSGTYYYIKGGTYTDWTLLYITSAYNAATIYPTLQSYAAGFSSDYYRIPTTSWLPTPLAYSTFGTPGATATESTGPDGQTTSALTFTGGAINNGTLTITPTLGSEMWDAPAAAFTSGTYGWTPFGTNTIANVGNTLQITYGSHAYGAKDVFRDSADLNSDLSTNTWYRYNVDASANAGTPTISVDDSYWIVGDNSPLTSSPTNHTINFRPRSTNAAAAQLGNLSSGQMVTLDNTSLKPLVTSSLFSTVNTSNANVIADTTISSWSYGRSAGIVIGLDSASNPSNFIIAYIGRAGWLEVEQSVSGVYSTIISPVNVPWGATKVLRVIKDGTAIRVYYNNALIGTGTASSSITGTRHGLFSDSENNTFDDFALWNRSGYTDLPDTNLTVTNDTAITYGGSAGSTKLVAGTSGAAYSQNVNVGDTATYTLSSMVYTTGAAVTSADMELTAGGILLPTTFTSMGSGWYRATATVTGVASSKAYGVYVHAGKTVYVDNLNLTTSSAIASTLYIQNSTSGLGGMNVESTTTLNSGLSSLQALIVKGALSQTANLQEWQSSTGTVLSAISASGALGLGNSSPNAKLDVISTSEQMRLGYDASNYWSSTVGATGALTMQGVGTGGSLTLSPTAGQNVNINTSAGGLLTVNSSQLTVNSTTGNVGIGTSNATAKLDIAATSGNDALRLTNSGTKIAGLSYGTNYLALDTNSTDPTNKLVNGSLDVDLSSWTATPSYTLNDQFNVDVAAGSVNGTSATPTGGTRTTTDTNAKLSATGGQLSFATGGVGAGDPSIFWPSTVRTTGKMIIGSIPRTNGTIEFGFDTNTSGNIGSSSLYNYGTLYAGPSLQISSFSSDNLAIILRSAGAYYYAKVGSNWNLVWIDTASSASPLYPAIVAGDTTSVLTADNIRIPTSTWLPTPIAYDTFTRADGAIGTSETSGPDSQATSALTWTGGAISGNKVVITPTTGSELITNGNMETNGSWNAIQSPISQAQSSEQTHGGTYSWKVVGSGSGESGITQDIAQVNGTWYHLNGWIYKTGGDYAYFPMSIMRNILVQTNNVWTEVNTTGRGTWSANVPINFKTGEYTLHDGVAYADDVSLKPLTLSSLFSTVSTNDTDVIADVNVTLANTTQAGLVTNLDSTSSPANFLIAYHDGANIHLDKNVGGTYTSLINTATTYSAGATLRVITYHSDTNTLKVRVYYNNALVGAEQTVTDASIISNTKHGMFSTYSGNTFDNFTLFPRGSSTTKFTSAPFEELTVTPETTTTFNHSTGSVKLVAGGTDGNYVQSLNVGDTQTYSLVAYAYTNGAAVTSNDVSLYYDGNAVTTAYSPIAGTGWYKLTGTVTGANAAKDYGVRVKAGKTVYVDDLKVQVGVGTAQTLYVMNTNSGVTGMNVQGLVNANQSGVATFTKAGTISDSDFTNGGVSDGMIGIDTTNHRIYFRENGAWSYAAKAGGFQIPDYEASGLTDGDFLLPYVDQHMADGAVHGLYQKFDFTKVLAKQGAITFTSDVSFDGPVIFKTLSQFIDQVVFKNHVAFEDPDMAGNAIISKYTDHVDVTFTKPFTTAPTIIFSLSTPSSSDSGYLAEGRQATLTNVTTDGFTLNLGTTALRDYLYQWVALFTPNATDVGNVSGVATESGKL